MINYNYSAPNHLLGNNPINAGFTTTYNTPRRIFLPNTSQQSYVSSGVPANPFPSSNINYQGLSIYDAPRMSGITWNNEGNFDLNQFTTTEKNWLGQETSKIQGLDAYQSWQRGLPPEIQALTNQFDYQTQRGLGMAIEKGDLNLNQINNVNQLKTIGDYYAQEEANSKTTPQDTWTNIQKGVGIATSLANLYYGFKQLKMAKAQQAHDMALQRAQFKNQAKSMNTQYRDQMSGRGTSLMSGQSKRALGRTFEGRRVSETY